MGAIFAEEEDADASERCTILQSLSSELADSRNFLNADLVNARRVDLILMLNPSGSRLGRRHNIFPLLSKRGRSDHAI